MATAARLVPLLVLAALLVGCAGKGTNAANPAGMTSDDAVREAHAAARSWASDAILFSVLGAEHGPRATVTTPPPTPYKADQGGRELPCGSMDDEAWAIIDPAWPGRTDQQVGDGRLTAWQVVYYSTSKNQGTAFIIRNDHDPVCVADPLTAQDREDLKDVRSATWSTDSAEALTAIRGRSARLDGALDDSGNAQVYYGFDLRSKNEWGIKGHAQDQGVSSFYATVDLSSPTVRTIDVK